MVVLAIARRSIWSVTCFDPGLQLRLGPMGLLAVTVRAGRPRPLESLIVIEHSRPVVHAASGCDVTASHFQC